MIRHGVAPYLECSSKGDLRFSAFGARIHRLGDRLIEEIYQSFKVFQDGSTGLHWREAKAKGVAVNQDIALRLYGTLWDVYLLENKDLITVLTAHSGLSDIFGKPGHACQATELWRIRCAAMGIDDGLHTGHDLSCREQQSLFNP